MDTHRLVVSHIERLTEDAVSVAFDVPEVLRGDFSHAPGQHVLVIREGVRRTYSISSAVGSPRLRIGVKQIPGGAMSSWLNGQLRVGDAVEVVPPRGQFTVVIDRRHLKRYAAIVAGSGITPVLSLAATILAEEPRTSFVLLYGNRSTSSIMFLEELEDLKNRYPDRFELHHVLSREAQASELLSGRLDRARLARLFDGLIPVADIDEWFLCGPLGLVETSGDMLGERQVPSDRIHREVFYADEDGAASPRGVGVSASESTPDPHAGATATVIATLTGRSTTVTMDRERETVLDAVLRARPDAPYACRGGVCGTCRALVVTGDARMDRSYALDEREKERGYVLACQSHPLTDTLELDFDR